MSPNNAETISTDRRRFLQLSGGGLAIAVLGITMPTGADAAAPIEISMKIVTGRMDGKPGWPKYEPANLKLPPNRLIRVTVRDYDDGAAEIPGGYHKVRGTVGGVMRVIDGTPATISAGMGKVVKEVPVKVVAHTFTVNGDNFFMNVPMPLKSTVVYDFKTPGPGKYPWQCMAACGTGAGGWAGAMATNGWMEGFITVG